jgi:hypothetical protein
MAASLGGYSLGVGTVVGAIGAGFAGAWFLLSPAVKEGPTFAAKTEATQVRDPAPEPPNVQSVPKTPAAALALSRGAQWVAAPPTGSPRDSAIAVLPVTPFITPLPVPEGFVPVSQPAMDASAQARSDDHIAAREPVRKRPAGPKPKSVDVKVKRGKDQDIVEVPTERAAEPTAFNEVGGLGSH